jgi:hypothetical protein
MNREFEQWLFEQECAPIKQPGYVILNIIDGLLGVKKVKDNIIDEPDF